MLTGIRPDSWRTYLSTFISEYNQTYHTSHLVIIVYILLCVSLDFEWDLKFRSPIIWNQDIWLPFCQKPFEIQNKIIFRLCAQSLHGLLFRQPFKYRSSNQMVFIKKIYNTVGIGNLTIQNLNIKNPDFLKVRFRMVPTIWNPENMADLV